MGRIAPLLVVGLVVATAWQALGRAQDAAAWVLPWFKGSVPEPWDDALETLKTLPKRLRAVAEGGLSRDGLEQLAKSLLSFSIRPPDPPVVYDFVADLEGALTDTTLEDRDFLHLAKCLYVVMNSAGLSASELKSLQSEVATLLESGEGDKDRIQTVVFDIATIHALIKEIGN